MTDFDISNANLLRSVKGSSFSGGGSMPVVYKHNDDGSISFAVPSNAPPDSVGYNTNRIVQMERKTRMIARLRAKLNK